MPSLAEMVNDFRAHFETAKEDAEKFLTGHLPALSALAEHAASNPAIDAVLNAVHLSPEMLQMLAALITKTDAELAALAPAPAPAEVPAEAPAEPAA